MLILTCIIFCLVTSGTIIPDTHNPLQMNMPSNTWAGQSLIFKFSLPDGSAGLNYKQFFGIVFPSSLATGDLNFSNTPATWSCVLSDGTNNLAVTGVLPVTSPTQSIAAQNNIAYCRLDEMVLVPLKTGISYTLTVTLGNKIASTQFIRQIGLFTI
jgi:hypothetical protein